MRLCSALALDAGRWWARLHFLAEIWAELRMAMAVPIGSMQMPFIGATIQPWMPMLARTVAAGIVTRWHGQRINAWIA